MTADMDRPAPERVVVDWADRATQAAVDQWLAEGRERDRQEIEQLEESLRNPWASWRRSRPADWLSVEERQRLAEIAAREELIEEAAERLRIQREARRRVATEEGSFGAFVADDVVDAAALLEEAEAEPLVEGLIGRGESVLLFGASYSGKSFVAQGIANAIATGTEWAGRAAEQGAVLYLLLEGRSTWRKRDQAWFRNAGVPRPQAGAGVDVFARSISLLDASTVADVAAHISARRYALIIVDTVSRAIAGADENAAEIVSGLVRALDQLREAGGHETSLLALHHPRKDDPEIIRGSSVLFAAMDRVLALGVKGGDPSSPVRVLKTQKSKAGQLPEDLHLEFVQVRGTESAVLIEGTPEGLGGLIIAIQHLQASGQEVTRALLKTQAAAGGMYASPQSANAAISRLVKAGRVIETGGALTLPEES